MFAICFPEEDVITVFFDDGGGHAGCPDLQNGHSMLHVWAVKLLMSLKH